jgi:DNA end-binding protein Ku
MSGKFNPAEFADRYQDAFIALVKAKVEGAPPVEVGTEEAPVSFNFMEALKRSVEQPATRAAAPEAAPAAKAEGARTPRKGAAKSVPADQTAQKPKKRKTA